MQIAVPEIGGGGGWGGRRGEKKWLLRQSRGAEPRAGRPRREGRRGKKRIIKKKGSRGRAAIGCGAHSLPGSQRLKFILAIKNNFCTKEKKKRRPAQVALSPAVPLSAGAARGLRAGVGFFPFFFFMIFFFQGAQKSAELGRFPRSPSAPPTPERRPYVRARSVRAVWSSRGRAQRRAGTDRDADQWERRDGVT